MRKNGNRKFMPYEMLKRAAFTLMLLGAVAMAGARAGSAASGTACTAEAEAFGRAGTEDHAGQNTCLFREDTDLLGK